MIGEEMMKRNEEKPKQYVTWIENLINWIETYIK